MSHIFLSYEKADRRLAFRVRDELRKAKKKHWIDVESIAIGTDFSDEIESALRTASAVVVILTPKSAASAFVTYEWAFALGAGVPVLPVLLEPTDIHLRLRSVQNLNLTGPKKEWSRLIQAIRTPHAHTSKGKPPKANPPMIFAYFELNEGMPVRVEESYRIWVGARNVPKSTDKVYYEIADETFKPRKWTVKWGHGQFEDWITSWGDVFINAKGDGNHGQWRTQATLAEALHRGYQGKKQSRAIRKAIANIENN